jgi:hypothetical protein
MACTSLGATKDVDLGPLARYEPEKARKNTVRRRIREKRVKKSRWVKLRSAQTFCLHTRKGRISRHNMTNEDRIKRIKALYPNLTDEECEIAAENLEAYLLLAWEIWEESNNKENQSWDKKLEPPEPQENQGKGA